MLAVLPGGQRYPLTIPLNLQTVAVDISVKENPAVIFVGMATRLGSYALYIHAYSLIFTSDLVLKVFRTSVQSSMVADYIHRLQQTPTPFRETYTAVIS